MHISTTTLISATTVATLFSCATAAAPNPTITAPPTLDKRRIHVDTESHSSACPGVFFAEYGTTGCCVGGSIDLSSCAGWPLCTTSATVDPANTLSCAEIISDSDSEFDSKVSTASVSLSVSGTVYRTVVGNGTISGGGVTATGTTGGAMPLATGLGAVGRVVGVLFGAAAFL